MASTKISTTKDNLKAVLIAEFVTVSYPPQGDLRDEVLGAIDSAVKTAERHQGDYIGYDAYLDAEITATA